MELTPVEQRVIGCLIEKERATPQNYPLTLNALRLACNQSSNRDPVVDYDERTIDDALTALRERGLTRIVYSTSNRAAKFRHVLADELRLGDDELAVLAVLLLRGPQTLGEIKGRTERLFAFADLGAVQATLDRLAAREDGPFVRRLERRPGQKDARYVHLLGDATTAPVNTSPHAVTASTAPSTERAAPSGERASDVGAPGAPATPAAHDMGERAAALAEEVERLRADVDALKAELAAFRAQFD